MTQEELNLIYELTDVYDKLVCIIENCKYKETAQIIRETMNSVYIELEKHKGALKHLGESSHDVAKEVAEERARNKEEFGWNGRYASVSLRGLDGGIHRNKQDVD